METHSFDARKPKALMPRKPITLMVRSCLIDAEETQSFDAVEWEFSSILLGLMFLVGAHPNIITTEMLFKRFSLKFVVGSHVRSHLGV